MFKRRLRRKLATIFSTSKWKFGGRFYVNIEKSFVIRPMKIMDVRHRSRRAQKVGTT